VIDWEAVQSGSDSGDDDDDGDDCRGHGHGFSSQDGGCDRGGEEEEEEKLSGDFINDGAYTQHSSFSEANAGHAQLYLRQALTQVG
jgi:hypothetical protein